MGRLTALLRRPSVRQRLLKPLGFDSLILVANLLTGVIVARSLGTSGRGELAATLLIAQMAAWVFSMGSGEAIAFHQSRNPEDADRLMSSWLLFTLPFSFIGLLVAELVLPTLFSAQTQDAVDLARLYVFTIFAISIQGIFSGLLLGEEDFTLFNLGRLIVPACSAITYALLWAFGVFSVELALAANAGAMCITLGFIGFVSLRRHRLVRPDIGLFRSNLWYGIRLHAGSAATLVGARLDLLILPAFLSAASVGLYSVATNVSSILPVSTGAVALMVLPVAARQRGSARTVIRTMQATMGLALVVAIPLAVLAPVALHLVYGPSFEAAATPLRILLIGAVLQVGAEVLWSGLLAADRPFLVTLSVLPGAVLTVVGLIIFLPIAGLTAAAIITTVTYGSEFAAMAFFYRRTLKIKWRSFIQAPTT